MDRGESSWLTALARFDRDQGWALDGQLCAAGWLMWRTKMGRATAYEKLHVAHALTARPVIADAFAAGRVSYSAVRAILRLEGPAPDVDAALVDLAEAGSVADVEIAVRRYLQLADQERPPPDPTVTRALRIIRHGDGTGRIEITLTEVEIDEFAATLQAFLDLTATTGPAPETPNQSARADTHPDTDPDGQATADREATDEEAVDEEAVDAERAGREAGPSARADSWGAWSPAGTPGGIGADWPQRRADALMDMTRTALAHAGAGHAMGADRYLVHLVAHHGIIETLDGTTLDAATADTVACDAATVIHLDQPLALGRKTRAWNTAQRRAILVRDAGSCRFPGCTHRIVDIHHRIPWEHGGPTDVSNGLLVCNAHHRLLHRGFTCEGDTNHTVTFHRPDGTPLGHSRPANRHRHHSAGV
jgi:hypothetical protein